MGGTISFFPLFLKIAKLNFEKSFFLKLKACKGCGYWKPASFFAAWERVDGRET